MSNKALKISKTSFSIYRILAAALLFFTLPQTQAADFTDIAVGNGFVCALESNGSVECSAPATLIDRVTPPAELPPLIHIAAGDADICGIDLAGDVHCWGLNFSGVYQAPDDLIAYESLSVGTAHWCGITTTRNIHCVGSNNFGESTTPEPFTAYNQVLARWQSTCGRRADNSVHCWGDGGPNRQEMTPFTGPLVYMMPQSRTSCGINVADQIVCDGATVPGFNGAFRRMTANFWGMCAVEYNGGIQCVPDPSRDHFSTTLEGLALDDVPVGGNYEKIDGRYTGLTCALGYEGDIACWGSRADGLRIPGTNTTLPTPENLRAEIYSGNTIELFWNAETRPRYVAPTIRVYEVWRDDVLVFTTGGSSFFDDSLTPGVNYAYKVKALGFDAESASIFSDSLNVNTLPDSTGESGGSATDAPSVEGSTISLAGSGWYQVQSSDTFNTVCEGESSCEVADGSYIAINHTTNERWEDIIVNTGTSTGGEHPSDPELPITPVSAVTVSGLSISWPNDGWYQVQDSSTYASVCEGGQTCTVAAGIYSVINHTTGTRWDDVLVSTDGSATGGNTETNAPQVNGRTISWQNNGWYQVQSTVNYSSICEGGTSCIVSAGTYNVINLTTGERWLATVE